MKSTLEFYECEHSGDLDNYVSDMLDCGATILSSSVDTEDEIGYVRFEVDDIETFMFKFKDTEAYEFVN